MTTGSRHGSGTAAPSEKRPSTAVPSVSSRGRACPHISNPCVAQNCTTSSKPFSPDGFPPPKRRSLSFAAQHVLRSRSGNTPPGSPTSPPPCATAKSRTSCVVPTRYAASRSRLYRLRCCPAVRSRPVRSRARSANCARALERKRGGASFRNLMARYSHHILAATPCVFVSPTSLAQFIPPGSATFDLVVFDEASQVTVAQAIGALGRGRAAVIVGDSQQMPPSTFGQVSAADDDEADEDGTIAPEDLESILTECVESGVPRLWLSWHYRSQDETLINFSNQKYYEGRLASLPSPGGDSTAGVEWRRVDGHFNRENRKDGYRTNRVEAEAIVEEIRTRLATPRLAGQSIGVVTFNLQQRVLVQDLLEACDDPLVREQLRPDKEDGIFVKNLENVQGDERDVILFTTAFSKKPGESQLPLQFGPLSRAGGEKRFNVAITRARRKVVIFTSFDPSDIDLSRTKSVGLAHLRGYLEMAAQRVAPSPSVKTNDNVDAVQRSICTALAERGYEVTTNYGLSEFVLDIVVREPDCDHWQVAVILDGPRWAGRSTVSDRDLTPRLLETLMHWGSSVRVWLPEWIENSGAVLDRIDAAVDTARERRRQYEDQLAREAEARAIEIADAEARAAEEVPAENLDVLADLSFVKDELDQVLVPDGVTEGRHELVASVAATPTPTIYFEEDLAPSSTERDWHGRGVAYICAPTTPLGEREDLDRVNSASVRRIITGAVRETVEIEGPILLERLARDIARRFGFDRVSAARRDYVIDCVPGELISTTSLGSFVWPRQLDQGNWRGFRATPDHVARPLSDIAPEEILNAMNAACTGRELGVEALIRETLAIFNQRRLTGPTRESLEECLSLGLWSGRLIQLGSVIRSGS
ncbi:AAA domain-containing protein [Rhodococcus coprophilus]|uniref:AAA domain-containing protein n=1 Tax=Rhodococcus coprophilus TaxID=38310 RepID=UPI0037A8EC9D